MAGRRKNQELEICEEVMKWLHQRSLKSNAIIWHPSLYADLKVPIKQQLISDAAAQDNKQVLKLFHSSLTYLRIIKKELAWKLLKFQK